ncbi:MAG TPA: CVNH domain-containing protein [Candidatus Angelobacter sp.]|nr:CVNH domain-containing protein [Candidatus Angelobacter sp.]
MRCLNTLIVLAMPMFLWSSAAVVAQESNPPGSYQQTCTDISVKKGNLYAKCQDKKGKAHSAKLSNYEKCSTEIINANGSLKCARANAPAQPPGSVLPPGSYLATCRDIWWQGTTLEANCNNGKDQWLPAILRNAHKCRGDIANHQGKLRCSPIKHAEKR